MLESQFTRSFIQFPSLCSHYTPLKFTSNLHLNNPSQISSNTHASLHTIFLSLFTLYLLTTYAKLSPCNNYFITSPKKSSHTNSFSLAPLFPSSSPFILYNTLFHLTLPPPLRSVYPPAFFPLSSLFFPFDHGLLHRSGHSQPSTTVRRVPLVKPFFLILSTKARGAVVERAGVRERQIQRSCFALQVLHSACPESKPTSHYRRGEITKYRLHEGHGFQSRVPRPVQKTVRSTYSLREFRPRSRTIFLQFFPFHQSFRFISLNYSSFHNSFPFHHSYRFTPFFTLRSPFFVPLH